MHPATLSLLVPLLCGGLALAASISGDPEQLTHFRSSANAAAAPPSAAVSNQSYMAWMRYMLQQRRQARQEEQEEAKRMSEFSMPYMKYRKDKRNNGIWVWMPAQGYVSVPPQQEDSQHRNPKPGKIMRYGK